MDAVGVDCAFSETGHVQVRQILLDEAWQRVVQGRQWLDQHGRHVLIMLSGNVVREIVLRPDTLTWELRPDRGDVTVA